MEVSPEELRGASKTMSSLATGMKPLPTAITLWPSSGMEGSATAAALGKSPQACFEAMQVLSGRYQEMADLLSESADTYQSTDEAAAARLKAMGDLNGG